MTFSGFNPNSSLFLLSCSPRGAYFWLLFCVSNALFRFNTVVDVMPSQRQCRRCNFFAAQQLLHVTNVLWFGYFKFSY
ncbi:MAG: hypothetical protein WCL71_07700, partial [Deltaproteobacteria bacterium]